MAERARKLKFKSETKKVLDIVINSLYSHPDIFLRELISNSSDALDKLRFEMLTNKKLSSKDELKITITPDEEAGTLTVSDNGIGMTEDEMASNLGTIAGSGTRNFLEKIKDSKKEATPEMIGQFGVGFYSSFMVADKVVVLSRKAGSKDDGFKWSSTGHETFSLKQQDGIEAGTSVILHLKEDMKEYLESYRLRELVRKYSDFISYPVFIEVEDETDKDQVNTGKPIWTRPESDVKDEEYNEFYKHATFDQQEPLSRLVFHAEGVMEFYSLLYMPAHRSMEMLMPDYKTGVKLYIRKVMIKEEADEILPKYLRFLKGVVESSDLPLNISRETLQNNRTVQAINKAITGKVLNWLADMKKNDIEKYTKFFENFGDFIKEGIYSDYQHREKLADLLLVWTSKGGDERKGLSELVEALPEDVDKIFYITGLDRKELANSPYLEAAGKDAEVILFDSPIDEFTVEALREYKDKKFVSLLKESAEDDLTEQEKSEKKTAEEAYSGLLEFMKDQLGDKVESVKISPRLKDSPCIIVMDKDDVGDMFRRMMASMEQEVPKPKHILELNLQHPLLEKLQKLYDEDRSGDELKTMITTVHALAQIFAGSRPDNPTEFGKIIADLLTVPYVIPST